MVRYWYDDSFTFFSKVGLFMLEYVDLGKITDISCFQVMSIILLATLMKSNLLMLTVECHHWSGLRPSISIHASLHAGHASLSRQILQRWQINGDTLHETCRCDDPWRSRTRPDRLQVWAFAFSVLPPTGYKSAQYMKKSWSILISHNIN